MADHLVIHIGDYAIEQLREEQGCPATQAVIVDAADPAAAIDAAGGVFRAFGDVGRCVALPYEATEKVHVPEEKPLVFVDAANAPEPKPEPPSEPPPDEPTK